MTAFTYEMPRDDRGFSMRFDPCTRQPKSWKEETYAAARAIANKTKKHIWVCFSGGIDSEVVCRAFYDQGIHFSVLTLEHTAGTNEHDIKYATKWCKARAIEQKIIRIDIQKFFHDEIPEYTDDYIAGQPFRYLQIKLLELVESLDGFAVLGGGEQLYRIDSPKPDSTISDVYLEFSVDYATALEWCRQNETYHEPYFFFSTPELCLSFLRLPLVQFAIDHPNSVFTHFGNKYTFKRLVYLSVWTDLELRYKYHGFENVMEPLNRSAEMLSAKFGARLQPYRLPVPAFTMQLTGDLGR